MFSIEFNVESTSSICFGAVTEVEIRYNFLPGSVRLAMGKEKIEMDWAWIPLVDFSLCLTQIVAELKDSVNSKKIFEFTESSETIEFEKMVDNVIISTSFSNIILNCSFNDFENGVKEFHKNISEYIKANVVKIESELLIKFLEGTI